MRSPVVELLADLAAALDGAGVPWFLFGAQAAILHGAARLTADVDVTVRLPETVSNETLAQELERHRFRRRIVDPVFVQRTRVIPFIHNHTGLPLDVVLAGPGIEERFFERVQLRQVEDVFVRLASPEDIVIMKMLAGRPKDLDDIVSIVAGYGDAFDSGYVEAMLEMLEQALSQSDLIPTFRQATARARRGL
ncbi:MAG: nucleotidyl transferase AbiEii/AbiGii toxin family protein [Acidobacteria bacterium]|nr:nucleotidyl transferase AbiEii/AbiGii toxin family protein [Acidobacteriota bacterium]